MNKPVYGDYDADAIERQYNPRLTVPDFERIFEVWRKRSDAIRATRSCRLDLAYGADGREKLDLFPAEGPAPPLHIFFHGGYWRAMEKDLFAFVAEALVESGVSVASVDYPLCPAVSLDRIVASSRAACAWLWRNGADLGVDRNRIQVSGNSAGAI